MLLCLRGVGSVVYSYIIVVTATTAPLTLAAGVILPAIRALVSSGGLCIGSGAVRQHARLPLLESLAVVVHQA